MMEALHTFETSVFFSETARRYIPERCRLDRIYVFTEIPNVEKCNMGLLMHVKSSAQYTGTAFT
jgi:hypothetical protein